MAAGGRHPTITPGRTLGAGEVWVTECTLDYAKDGSPPWQVCAVLECREGKIARMTEFFGPPFEPGRVGWNGIARGPLLGRDLGPIHQGNMKGNRLILIGLLLGPAWWLVWAEPAHAYLDPGAGSYLLQVLLAVGLGALFALRSLWYRLWKAVAGLWPHRRETRTREPKPTLERGEEA